MQSFLSTITTTNSNSIRASVTTILSVEFPPPIREVDHFYSIASSADFGLIYPIFTLSLCPSSCYGQPLQGGTFIGEREKAVGIANEGGVSPDALVVEILKRGWE